MKEDQPIQILAKIIYTPDNVILNYKITVKVDELRTLNWTAHDTEVTWSSWYLKSHATRLFNQQLLRPNTKEKFKAHNHKPFVKGNHRWQMDPPHNGPVMQEASHALTSSYFASFRRYYGRHSWASVPSRPKPSIWCDLSCSTVAMETGLMCRTSPSSLLMETRISAPRIPSRKPYR